MILSKLNGIAARIAIVLAIIVGLVMIEGLSFGLNLYRSRHDRSPHASSQVIFVAFVGHRNLVVLSGEISCSCIRPTA